MPRITRRFKPTSKEAYAIGRKLLGNATKEDIKIIQKMEAKRRTKSAKKI